jgi:histidyl-tRNA synthetase
MSNVKPTLPRGFRDYLPGEMIPRLMMLDTIREVFERFGFDPLDTSAVERWDVLGVEEDGAKQVYLAAKPEQLLNPYGRKLRGLARQLAAAEPDAEAFEQTLRAALVGERMDNQQRTLRFDLTVSLARCVAANWHSGNIARPFKRWQSGRVWRGENTQKGRYREFMQFDADIVGSSSMDADATIVWMMAETLRALKVGGFTISVNSRKILNGLPALAGFDPALITEVLIILDKQDKIGAEAVQAELAEAAGLSGAQVETIAAFQALSGETPEALLDAAAALFEGIEIARQGVEELRQIAAYLRAVGLDDAEWRVDFSIARGLGYYTGPVFETLLHDLPSIGSVLSGGRYDGLVGGFIKDELPAVGASIGVDRLFAALQELGRLPERRTVTQVTVLPIDDAQRPAALAALRALQDARFNSEIYAGDQRKLGKRLKEIEHKGVPYVVIIGGEEAAAGAVKVRSLMDRSVADEVLPLADLAGYIAEALGD